MLTALLAGLALTGCEAQPPRIRQFEIAPGGYAAAVDRTRDTLRRAEFELDRVDARAGVITTNPRQWAGVATPWLPHSAEPGADIDGLMHHERRIVRVTFRPTDRTIDPADQTLDLRTYEGPVTGSVEVLVQRIYRPHRRIGVPSVRMSSFARDPGETGLEGEGWFIVDHRRDEALADRMARAIGLVEVP